MVAVIGITTKINFVDANFRFCHHLLKDTGMYIYSSVGNQDKCALLNSSNNKKESVFYNQHQYQLRFMFYETYRAI